MLNSLRVRVAALMSSAVIAAGMLGAVAAYNPDSAVAAPRCEAPMNHLDVYQADADALGMPLNIRMEVDHPGFAVVYSNALGLAIPADSQMIGIFFVEGPDAVFVGLIEPAGCVRYTIIIPRQAHDFAMASAAAGA